MKPVLEVAMQSWVGRVIADRYALERVLGSGGCGAVFRARHLVTKRHIALKVIPCAEIDDATARRFELEASAPARVDHPSMVEVYDAGYDPEGPCLYVAQELLIGKDLRTELETRGKLPWREAVTLLVPAMSAIASAHRAGLLQRDIKPENLFLAYERGATVTKVLDWGIALAIEKQTRVTTEGALVGTPWYLAPELVGSSRNASARSDVWAMACVLFECIAGNSPFDGESTTDVIAAVLTAPTPRIDTIVPEVPRAVADVIARGLERDPAGRFQTMAGMLEELLRAAKMDPGPWVETAVGFIEDGPTSVMARETTEGVTTQVRRRKTALSSKRSRLLASISLVLSLGVASLWAKPSATPAHTQPTVRPAAPLVPTKIAAAVPVVPVVAAPVFTPTVARPADPPRREAPRRPRRVPTDAGLPNVETLPPRNGAPVFEP